MYQFNFENIVIRVIKGDITKQDTEAVVNAANKRLAPGGGVAGAIHSAAGPMLWEECKKIVGCETGKAVITKGYKLPAKWIIHTVGPVWSNKKEDPLMLSASYENSLILADENNIKSISFPAISAGAFGYPLEEAAEVAVETVCRVAEKLSAVKLVQFVLYDDRAYHVFEEKVKNLGKK
jgi:O-acetyl-ADP-ribose deacetylase (regulator of RNase III)